MCDFFSAIYRRDGAEYHDKTNSHSGMVQAAGWAENGTQRRQVFWEAEWQKPFEGDAPGLIVRDGEQPTRKAARAWERRCDDLRDWWNGKRLDEIPSGWIDVAVICGLNCKQVPINHPVVGSLLEHIDRVSRIEWLTAVDLPTKPIADLRLAISKWAVARDAAWAAARDVAGAAARDAVWDAARDAAEPVAWDAAGAVAGAVAVILAGDTALQNKPNLFNAYRRCYEAGVMFDGDIIRGKDWRELGRLSEQPTAEDET